MELVAVKLASISWATLESNFTSGLVRVDSRDSLDLITFQKLKGWCVTILGMKAGHFGDTMS